MESKGHTAFTNSPLQTQNLAEAVGRLLAPGDIALLEGDLGAGKTTFAQGLCRGAGMDPSQFARSPTFTLVNEYQGRFPIRHADLYRLDTVGDLEQTGLFDPAFTGVTIIEWGDKIAWMENLSPVWRITLVEISETRRRISVQAPKGREKEITHIITARYGEAG